MEESNEAPPNSKACGFFTRHYIPDGLILAAPIDVLGRDIVRYRHMYTHS